MAWLLAILVWVLSAAAAMQMARRKGRNVNAWGTLGFFIAPSLLILLFVPTKRDDTASSEPSILKCPACEGAISSQADRCPHCGHPLANTTVKTSWYGPIIEVLGVAAVVTMIGVGIYSVIELTTGGLPTCDSSLAQSEVSRAFANAPLGKVMGLSIVSFSTIQSSQSNAKLVGCTASVTLSNNTKHQLIYSFTAREGDTYWVEARLAD